VFFNTKTLPVGEEVNLAPLVNYEDSDGNSIKRVRFFDTSSHSFSGHLVRAGVVQSAKQWVEVPIGQLQDMVYVSADRQFDEQIRVQVYDGRYWSAVNTIVMSNIERPNAGSDRMIETMQLEFIPGLEIVDKIDGGPDYNLYQIVDLTSGGAGDPTGFWVNGAGIKLASNQIHTLSPDEFSSAGFVSGKYEVRSSDELMVRARNEEFWSEWTRITVRTEPEIGRALLVLNSLNPIGYNEWGDWIPLIDPDLPPDTVTFSFMDSFPIYNPPGAANTDNFSTLTPAQRANVRFALEHYASFANVNFVEVVDGVLDPDTGRRGGFVRIGNYTDPDDDASGYAFYPGPGEVNGDIFINLAFNPGSWNPGSSSYETFIHEFGHAMGFEHPFYTPPDQAGEPPHMPPSIENSGFSVMSYTPREDFVSPASYQLYDIYSAQVLYDARSSFNSGNNTYDIAAFGGQAVVTSIWDTGGTDVLSGAGSSAGVTVDLREGSRSSIGSLAENITIAYGVQIENGIGSGFNDMLIGNHVDNMLQGNNGDDTLWGYGGNDSMLGGAGNDRYLYGIGDGFSSIMENANAGRDTLEITNFPGMNDLENDLSFRKVGRDLLVDLTLNQGDSQRYLKIVNQQYGGWRIESLEIGGDRIDLVNLFSQASTENQSFRITNESSIYGSLVVPV
jgi:serralysin